MTLETSRSYFEASVAREPQKALKVLNAIRREEVERSLILFTYRIHLRSIMLRTPLSRLFFINVSTCSAARSAGTGEIHGLWAKVFETGLNLDDWTGYIRLHRWAEFPQLAFFSSNLSSHLHLWPLESIHHVLPCLHRYPRRSSHDRLGEWLDAHPDAPLFMYPSFIGHPCSSPPWWWQLQRRRAPLL